MSPLTMDQADKLRHALGVSEGVPSHGLVYRNYYCAEDGDEDMQALVAAGLMVVGHTINGGRDRYYHATPLGMRLVGVKGERG